ncbi:carbohydrate ABC transporter permease [Cohnella sp. REN36]|uniref:carbohydrate ABC transporter permease n=1 Tax=Cohnella sp. REN36 TaxID=2887347 RepID=UPI001D15C0F5|nr:carbohydrate ABC transporter permease [Cohnella sp. REN36]MCC3374275.1 carbohydrate ABC transporter permease [Cohnella sp. REN36]
MRKIATMSAYLAVTILAVLWLLPIALVLMNASKSYRDYTQGNMWAWPESFQLFANMKEALHMGELGRGMLNSFLYSSLGAGISILLAALAAFGIVILRLKGGFYWFLLIYSGTIFPFQMYLVPLFKGYQKLGMYDTFWGMLFFYVAIAIPFCLFLLRNFMTTIPYEMIEAAQMDGFRSFGIFSNIVAPLLVPPVSVLMLFQFTWIWNDLIFGMTLSRSETVRPVMAGLSTMQGMFFRSGVTTLLAGIVLTSIPTLILFFSLQRNFIKGMQLSVKS